MCQEEKQVVPSVDGKNRERGVLVKGDSETDSIGGAV